MFSGGFTEIGFILFIAFLVFGPKKLPEIARVLGKGMGELRRASDELKSSLEQEIRNLDRPDGEISNPEEDSYTYAKTEEESYEHPDEESYGHAGEESYEHADEDPYVHAGEESYEHTEEESYDHVDEESYEHLHEETQDHPANENREVSEPSQGDLEPAPEYGYDYSEPTQHEPEPRG